MLLFVEIRTYPLALHPVSLNSKFLGEGSCETMFALKYWVLGRAELGVVHRGHLQAPGSRTEVFPYKDAAEHC